MCNQFHNRNITWRRLWTAFVFLLVLGAPLVTGVKLSPCGAEDVRRIFHNQPASFNCTAEGQVQWRLHTGSMTAQLLSTCDTDCVRPNTFGGLFTARSISSDTSTMTINPVNNTTLYKYVQFLNGSLICNPVYPDNMSARCELDYVYPPERVKCTASAIAWSVNVSCDIERMFSSRGNYKCELIHDYNKSQHSTLQNVTMVTSPTSEKISENEVKVSGVCQFNTTLPAEEGIYSFSVSISYGMPNAHGIKKWFTVERPRQPTVSCYSQPYVLENTEVNCTCNTTSRGQPAGLLMLTTGNQTGHRKTAKQDKRTFEPYGIYYTQILTLLDHDNTWFRCDVTWGTKTIKGNNYTAQVGYAARTPRLFAGGRLESLNETVLEGDNVHFVCQSEGRPTPTVHIYSLDNSTEVWRDSSPANYTFIARCEDAASYKCYAKNLYSTQSNISTSVGLDLYVRCKPSDASIADFGKVAFGNKTEKLNFDVMAYPVPHAYAVWFVGRERNNSEDISMKVEDSEMNVTCKAHVQHRYLSTCTLAIFSVPFNSGFYKVQVANDHGDQNFTVDISYDYDEPAKVQTTVYVLGAVVAVVFTITVAVLIVVILKRKRKESSVFEHILSTSLQNIDKNSGNGEGGQPVQAPEIIYETPWDAVPVRAQGLEVAIPSCSSRPCQTPLYAVVDKMKKTRMRETKNKQVSESFHKDSNPIYAVVDKVRGKTSAKRAKGQTADTEQSRKSKKDPWKKVGPTVDGAYCFDDTGADYVNAEHLAMHSFSSQRETSGMESSFDSRQHEQNDRRWGNDDGLIYMLPVFDVSTDARRPPAPRSEETEYCTLRGMENKFPALDKK